MSRKRTSYSAAFKNKLVLEEDFCGECRNSHGTFKGRERI